ncbi:protein PSK SIMULATOR 3-like [Andrographis paniculata]|uniref:protein PSK SIMULATOR 3-like n=1 Tax=Andrographis paniculata TaxID=175694 RepID=UPI0021E854DD|nr:protein PSK SIMULATOR 3-like [Andrographis paniculata]
MVAEPWILKLGNQVSSNLKHALYLENSTKSTTRKQSSVDRRTIGILSFEVANLLSKIIHLHKSLTDAAFSKLRNEILKSEGIKTLISGDEQRLLELAFAEKLDDLNRVAAVVSRLGKKCTIPALQGFEHVYGDIISGAIDVKDLGFLVKDMDAMVRKMERYAASTAALYSEMEVMNELESAAKKFQQSHHEESRKVFEQKLSWQKQDVRHLKNISLWNETFDKVVESLARAVCTIYARLLVAFDDVNCGSQIAGKLDASDRSSRSSKNEFCAENFKFACGIGPGRLLMECLSLSSKIDDDDDKSTGLNSINRGTTRIGNSMQAPSTTVGGSALAMHYANIIVVLEKLLRYPHLVGDETRDDLYQMLPTSLRRRLEINLKSYVKDLAMAIYDAPLAHAWRERLGATLTWLAPLAHNMIRWQSERNFEQHQIVTRTNVLLLQTIYFADREKTEAVVCEVLLGLNYICRYEQQQSALVDCASSFDYDDCVEWQSQFVRGSV